MVAMAFPPFEARLVRCAKDGAVVALRGELDLATVPTLQAVLDVALSRTCRLTLDLRDLTFMGATGLRVLISAHQRVGQIKEAIVLYKPSPMVVRLLKMTGMDSSFDIRADRLLEDVGHQSTDTGPATRSALPEPPDYIDIRIESVRESGSSRWSLSQ
jgi:anti-sigma B factor antagonist